jgi:hypothetical protein
VPPLRNLLILSRHRDLLEFGNHQRAQQISVIVA